MNVYISGILDFVCPRWLSAFQLVHVLPCITVVCVAGSSAGAGSEVFHIYRHLRRKETIRQDFIRSQADKVCVCVCVRACVCEYNIYCMSMCAQ